MQSLNKEPEHITLGKTAQLMAVTLEEAKKGKLCSIETKGCMVLVMTEEMFNQKIRENSLREKELFAKKLRI